MSKEMPTTREELAEFVREYIKENLSIRIDEELKFGGHTDVNVEVNLDGEFISSDYFTLYKD